MNFEKLACSISTANRLKNLLVKNLLTSAKRRSSFLSIDRHVNIWEDPIIFVSRGQQGPAFLSIESEHPNVLGRDELNESVDELSLLQRCAKTKS